MRTTALAGAIKRLKKAALQTALQKRRARRSAALNEDIIHAAVLHGVVGGDGYPECKARQAFGRVEAICRHRPLQHSPVLGRCSGWGLM